MKEKEVQLEVITKQKKIAEDAARKYLRSLTNKELVEFMTTVFDSRRSDEGLEARYVQARWCIAEVSRMLNDEGDDWSEWQAQLLALHDPEEYKNGWESESPLCQFGECSECGMSLLSWAKKIICPVCDSKAYAT